MKNSQYDFRAGTRRDEGDVHTPKLKIGVISKKSLISAQEDSVAVRERRIGPASVGHVQTPADLFRVEEIDACSLQGRAVNVVLPKELVHLSKVLRNPW